MSIELKIKDTIKSLNSKYADSDWNKVLSPIINHPQMEINLIEIAKSKQSFNPAFKYIFKAFENCPLDKLKMVVINNNPTKEFSNGMAFSALQHTDETKAFSDIIYPKGLRYDFTYLANKGVLLYNKNLLLTTEKVDAVSWDFAIDILLDYLKLTFGIVYLIVGEENEKYAKQLSMHTYKFFAPEPSPIWKETKIIEKIAEIIKNNYNEDILV